MSKGPDFEFHLIDFYRILKNRFPIVLTIFFLSLITAYIGTVYFVQKVYSSKAEIRIQKTGRALEVFHANDPNMDLMFLQSESETIKSKKTIQPVIEQLNLRKIYAKRFLKTDTPFSMEATYGFFVSNLLKVTPKRNTSIINIEVFSLDRDEAALIANTIADVYIQARKDDQKYKFGRGLNQLSKEIDKQKATYQQAKNRIEELRKELNIDDISGSIYSNNNTQLIDMELQRKSQLLDEIKDDVVGRKVRMEKLSKMSIKQLLDVLPALGLQDENLSLIRQQQLNLEGEIQRLQNGGLGVDHPQVKSFKAQIKTVNRQIRNMVEGKRRALSIDYDVAKARYDNLSKEVSELTKKVRTQKTEKIAPFRLAQEDAQRQLQLLDSLIIRYKQQAVDKSIEMEPAILLSQAAPSERPVKPNLFLNLALSAIFGLVLGLSIAFLIEYMDTSLKTVDEVESFLGLSVVGVIPNNLSPLHQISESSPHGEPYRILWAKLDLKPKEGQGNSTCVVSGGPGEGKSLTLFNLAYVCAKRKQSTLIIDADMRRPSQHTLLGIPKEEGLADVFLERGEAYQYIKATPIPNLHIITAGKMPMEQIGSMNASKLREILTDMKLRYDVVLVDSPPVLGISDGSIITNEVDQTLLVIQHRRYPRDVSLKARDAIQEVNGNLAGVVLNSVSVKSHESYYYYSTYQYYYVADEEKEARSKKKNILASSKKITQENNKSDSF